MVNNYAAGDRLRAPVLRDRAAAIAMLGSNISTLQVQPAFVDAPGLALPVRSNSRYMIDGWFGMGGGSVGDFAWRLVGPADCFLTWNSLGPQLDQTDSIGEVDCIRKTTELENTIPDTISTLGCGAENMGVHVSGRLLCRGFGGSLQLQFAKNVESTGADAHVLLGSWMRIYRVDPSLFE